MKEAYVYAWVLHMAATVCLFPRHCLLPGQMTMLNVEITGGAA